MNQRLCWQITYMQFYIAMTEYCKSFANVMQQAGRTRWCGWTTRKQQNVHMNQLSDRIIFRASLNKPAFSGIGAEDRHQILKTAFRT
jgi:hypothetical protein